MYKLPENNGRNYLAAGAGFQPSTVPQKKQKNQHN